ncbi:MAG: hypothetical protein JWR80_8597 [Bradyrhizobium sp.]|nr:hypothetical protein [Bradyrhizobium sp.]
MIGVAAHITAAAKGGERWDPSLSSAQRRAADNGVWMCAIHAKWIDDNPSIATTPKLRAWKASHEAEIAAWVEHGHPGIYQSWDRLAALTRDQLDTIETALPNGHVVARDGAPLVEALTNTGACMVSGDSGVGKSALVKTTLDTAFPEARQIWLGPEALRDGLSEANRVRLGLTAPLGDLLNTSAVEQNILVVDAVERADGQTIAKLRLLIDDLAARRAAGEGSWKVVAIGQQAGFEVHLDALFNALGSALIAIPPLGEGEVRLALQGVPALAQHACDDAFVALLGNIRTLAWIIAAGPLFAGADTGQLADRTRIADRLWSHWTGGDPHLHSFMIRLARRDADYERSFGLSDLSQEDRDAWSTGRQRVPLVLSARNRLSFEHDLASDWARFQYLKEIGRHVGQWSPLAAQPLWVAALRLFGQYLLREPDQARDGWDWAFAEAQAARATDAADVLLDALCLDPLADTFLLARAELLFANEGALLNRLLTRFLHIATVPERSSPDSADLGVGLYVEAEMRSPLWTYWPPLIRFLARHRGAIAAFGSRTVARLCEMWLSKAPVRIENRPVIGRTELAELALETARTHQIANIGHATYGGSSESYGMLFTAALSGAEDRLEAVSQFALEMARRRTLSDAGQARVNAIRAADREQRRTLAANQPRRQRSQAMTSFSNRTRLPPWPLGPVGRLEQGFRDVVLKNGALNALMRCAPDVAAEVLLACIIDDNPHEEFGGMHIDWRLGLDHHHDDRPTIFWNSPFFSFLSIAPEAGLTTLLDLLEFCTERWTVEETERPEPVLILTLADGTMKGFAGDPAVLDWSHTRRSTNSQLFMALDALERWLWLKIERGEDVDALCGQLLERSRSAAILGILADCAKSRPELLRGALAPLMTSPMLLQGDEARIPHRGFGGDMVAWLRAGEAARQKAAEWEQAPHRKATLKQVIRDLRRTSAAFDAQARHAFEAWPAPAPELALKQRYLLAELDPANWHEGTDPEGTNAWQFRCPDDIAAEIDARRDGTPAAPSLRAVLGQLEVMLGAGLDDEDATALYEALDGEALAAFGVVERRLIETAIAAVLFCRASDWMRRDIAAMQRLSDVLRQSVRLDGGEISEVDDRLEHGPGLLWACVGAVSAKAGGFGSAEIWDRIIALGIATGDAGVIRTIIAVARPVREALGDAWWGIFESAVLAAALDALRPRIDGDPGSILAVGRWRRQLARRPLAGKRDYAGIDLLDLAERVERLSQARFGRAYGENVRPRHWRGRRRRFSLGISTHLLSAAFDWALDDEHDPPSEVLPEHRQILRQLWGFVEWRLRGDPEEQIEDQDGFDRIDDFGLSVLRALAARIPLGTETESRPLWEPVLALGPRGEFTVEHLIACLFLRLYKEIDPAKFSANWSAMLAYVFVPEWQEGGRWYKGRSILRHMLGIDALHQLAACPLVMARVPEFAPYFENFAAHHIAHDDSSLAAFAYFLAAEAGAPLRLRGIQWIETALAQDDRRLRDSASGAIADFANVLLTRHDAALIADRPALQALIDVIARMVRDQVPLALALQDRVRALRCRSRGRTGRGRHWAACLPRSDGRRRRETGTRRGRSHRAWWCPW